MFVLLTICTDFLYDLYSLLKFSLFVCVFQCLLVCGLVAMSKAGAIPHAAQYTLNYDNQLGTGTYVAAAPAVAHHQTFAHQQYHHQYQQHAPLLVAQPQQVHAVAPAYTTAIYRPAPAPVAAIPALPANHYVDYYVSPLLAKIY